MLVVRGFNVNHRCALRQSAMHVCCTMSCRVVRDGTDKSGPRPSTPDRPDIEQQCLLTKRMHAHYMDHDHDLGTMGWDSVLLEHRSCAVCSSHALHACMVNRHCAFRKPDLHHAGSATSPGQVKLLLQYPTPPPGMNIYLHMLVASGGADYDVSMHTVEQLEASRVSTRGDQL